VGLVKTKLRTFHVGTVGQDCANRCLYSLECNYPFLQFESKLAACGTRFDLWASGERIEQFERGVPDRGRQLINCVTSFIHGWCAAVEEC